MPQPNKQHLSRAFREGYEASSKGVTRMRNPYYTPGPEQPKTAHDWHEGWNTRFYGENIYGEIDP